MLLSVRNEVVSIELGFFPLKIGFFLLNSAFSVRSGVKGMKKVNLYKKNNFRKVNFLAFRSKWGLLDRTRVFLIELRFFNSNWRFSGRSGIKSKKKVNTLQKV